MPRASLAFVLLLALAVRLWIVLTHTYIMFPDETFQYLEPAHRLAFGSGVITWEYLDGIRSWLLPGVLAGVMRLVAAVDPDPEAYILVLRLMFVFASLAVPFVAFRLVQRRCGLTAALIAGLLCACSIEAVYAAPVIMSEPAATYAALLAIWLGDDIEDSRRPRARLLAAGLLFGLASSLRFQYAPILGIVVLIQHARSTRNLLIVAAGGLAVVLAVFGVLDTLTLGLPFQSVWLNYVRNVTEGVSAAMGEQAGLYYVGYYMTAWDAGAPLLIALAILWATRAPLLAAVVVCTIGLHSFLVHKEPRFIFLAVVCLPMLIGAGIGRLIERLPPRLSRVLERRRGLAAVLGLLMAGGMAASTYAKATMADAWHRDRSMLRATAAARDVPGVCGLGIRVARVYRTGGYVYWHRDAPIYFETWERSQRLDSSSFRMRLDSRLNGQSVPHYPDEAFAANATRFNVILGGPNDGLPGFAKAACYGSGQADDPLDCVFTRPGGCD
jgi:4-amino-4-deoxy-L-arabinose transferase-like glycosyltransferase